MSLIEKNKDLFIPPYPDNTEENFRYIFREFLKTDDLFNNRYMGIIYDFSDYQEYR